MKANAPTPTSGGAASVAVLPHRKSTAKRANGQHPSPADPVLAIIERAARDPVVDLDKMQRLLDMRACVAREAAERVFNDAMTAAQAEMEPIGSDAANPHTRSRYASLAKLDRTLRPIYTAHGFSLSFSTEPAPAEQTVRVVCYVTGHGHTRTYQLDVPADGKGAKAGDVMSRTHATASACTYGQRYLLRLIFNLATFEADDDGNAAAGNGTISPSRHSASSALPARSRPMCAAFAPTSACRRSRPSLPRSSIAPSRPSK